MELPVMSYSFCIADGKSVIIMDDWSNNLHASLLRTPDFTLCLNRMQLVPCCT